MIVKNRITRRIALSRVRLQRLSHRRQDRCPSLASRPWSRYAGEVSRPPTAVLVALVRPTAEGLAILWHRLTGEPVDVEAFRVLLAARLDPPDPR